MNADLTKLFGWLLLLVGVGIIIWTLYSSYDIFTGKVVVPEIFKFETQAQAPTKEKTPTTQEELQKQIGELIGEQLKGILSVDTISKLLNLIVWSMLAGILILGGGQISGLGIKLLKK